MSWEDLTRFRSKIFLPKDLQDYCTKTWSLQMDACTHCTLCYLRECILHASIYGESVKNEKFLVTYPAYGYYWQKNPAEFCPVVYPRWMIIVQVLWISCPRNPQSYRVLPFAIFNMTPWRMPSAIRVYPEPSDPLVTSWHQVATRGVPHDSRPTCRTSARMQSNNTCSCKVGTNHGTASLATGHEIHF